MTEIEYLRERVGILENALSSLVSHNIVANDPYSTCVPSDGYFYQSLFDSVNLEYQELEKRRV